MDERAKLGAADAGAPAVKSQDAPRSSIDVVIVNFHSGPLIGRAIATARAFVGTAARVIVVDNSPGDGAADVVRAAAPEALVIANPVNRGFATAVNQAIAAGKGEIVVLVNPDVQEISGTSTDVMSAFRDARVGAVATRLLNADGTIQPNCFRAPQPFDVISEEVALAQRFPNWRRPRRFRMLDCDHGEVQEVDWAAGACLFLRRAALAEVGQFDERFFVYCEETDWLVRAEAARLADALPPVGHRDARLGLELPRRGLEAVAPAPREPASVRAKALWSGRCCAPAH